MSDAGWSSHSWAGAMFESNSWRWQGSRESSGVPRMKFSSKITRMKTGPRWKELSPPQVWPTHSHFHVAFNDLGVSEA